MRRTTSAIRTLPLVSVLLLACAACRSAADRYGASHAASDGDAVDIAESVLERMGGREAWDRTRCIAWSFFGGRRHVWDRHTGTSRVEVDDVVIVLDVATREGRAWRGGEEVTDPDALADLLDQGHRMWVNDSYWVFMPYKLLDPGCVLRYVGRATTADGRPAEVLELTFEDVGYTPRNAYHVRVPDDSGLVEEWSFWPDVAELEGEPGFTMPWAGWERFGEILLATDHGRGADWRIEVLDEPPPGVFEGP